MRSVDTRLADIGDVGLARKNGQSNRAHFLHGRIHKRQHDIQIMDHQVQYYIDIESAGTEDAEPVYLEEHGLSDERDGCSHGGIETLEVPNLRDALVLLCHA
jgi:hypothetical protein